ncbi:MAG: glycosyltransferase [Halobellus sp.]|uniref:glycosyltransferase n=1 Tax=Halobellus sp. TaxID=1979212 RepID=UPI0035D4450F
MTRSVGIVVPAYRPDPERLTAYLDALTARLDLSVVRVELDAPRSDIYEQLGPLPDCVEVATADRRRGKGTAITAGFEALVADVDVLAFADADGSTPSESFASIVSTVTDGDADLAVGSRRHPDADVATHQTLARRRLGDGFAWLARRMLDESLYDYQCGAKALTADTWRDVREHLYEPGFAWDIELVAITNALEHQIVEVPVRWEDQPGSTVSTVGTTLRFARALVTARHRARLLREDRLHELLATGRSEPSLLDRLAAGETEAVEAD